ncbi:MAG: lysylphosphatidylglycerol synthase transmembrane domain-containing protein [Thermogutta sp.]
MRAHSRFKRTCVQLLKIAASVAILAWLVWDSVRRGEGLFSDEHGFQPEKLWALVRHAVDNWLILLLAFICAFASVMITFIRWWLLIRSVGVPISLRESLRFSFVGYLLNLAPMGIVGGDLAKAVLVARHCPEHRAPSVASVFVDRVVGLYVLLLVASGAILLTNFHATGPAIVQSACRLTLVVSVLGTIVLLLVWAPDWTGGRVRRLWEKLPVVGRPIARFTEAFRAYGREPGTLLLSLVMTLPVHLLFAIVVFLVGTALFPKVHSLDRHFVFAPLAGVMQVLPISVGPAEFVLDRLFVLTPTADGSIIPPGQGLVTLLVYRVFNLLISTVGVVYFLMSREEWREALHEVEEAEEPPRALEIEAPKPN